VNAFGHPLPYPETGSTEAGHTPFLVQEVMGGGMLGVDAGSTICGYEIAGIGHGVHMRLVTYPDPACIILGWVWVVCCLSGYPRKNV
jgi:hypothetical protein